MGMAAVIFLTLGILLIGFGILSLGNVFNSGITQHQRDNADLSDPRFQMTMVRIILMGGALMAIGILIALLM
jgi:hypothetical protein